MATSLHGWQLKPISLSPLACLLAWRVPTGSQRVPKGLQKGTPKWPKIDQKSTRAALGMPKGVRGYPPGAVNMHLYAYLCIYLQYFVHIYVYFEHIYACFHWFPAYLYILLYTSPIFMHIYAYLCIFRHISECLCIFDAYLYTSVLFVNICTYLQVPIHEKTLICWPWKIMQPGYTPQGVEISASTLNIHLSISITGSINIHSNAEPEWHHGTVAGSALCAFRYI